VTRARRALALIVLAAVLGVLAASNIGRREAALRDALAPMVPVVVAAQPLAAGRPIARSGLRTRRVPLRFAPRTAFRGADDVAGRRAAVAIAQGTDLDPALLGSAAPSDRPSPRLRRGERALEVIAVAAGDAARPGARVDVLATAQDAGGATGRTRLALADAEVLAAARAPGGETAPDGLPRMRVTLRVQAARAVALAGELADAQVRLLARP
jgi:pilus assembly protein CpaB